MRSALFLPLPLLAHVAVLSAQVPVWRLSEAPVLSIGAVEGGAAYLLSQVRSALRLADGRVVVVNSGTNEIRVFDARGKHIASHGRKGNGPGEYQWLFKVLRALSDTLLAYDAAIQTVTVLSPTFDPVGTVRLPQLIPTARNDDGSYLIVMDGFGVPRQQGLHEYSGSIRRFDPVTKKLDTLAIVPGGQAFFRQAAHGFARYPVPFAPGAAFAVDGNVVYYGAAVLPEILRFDRSGRSLGSLRIADRRREVTRSDVRALLAWYLRGRNESEQKDWRQAFAHMKPAARTPAHGALLADVTGNLWVQRFGPVYAPALDWDIYAPDGRAIRTLRLPPRYRPLEIGADYVLGVSADEMAVERVLLHTLTRPG